MTRYARDFGVVMDGATDNSDAVWQASMACYPLQEKLVFDPSKCRIEKPQAIPPGVVWIGEGFAGRDAASMPSGWDDVNHRWDNNLLPPTGTIIVVDPPEPDPYPTLPRFQLRPGAGMIGFTFVEAQQDPFAIAPRNTPATIAGIPNYSLSPNERPTDISLRDLWFVNTNFAIDGTGWRRHHISNIFGNPLSIGIHLDDVDDLGEVSNVHFHSGLWKEANYDPTKILTWVSANRIGLDLGQMDDLHLANYFVHGAACGIRCRSGKYGKGPYGKLANLTLEMCQEGVRIDDTTGGGGALCFSNFEVIVGTAAGSPSDDETGINVRYIRHCPVKFSNGVIRVARGHGVNFIPLWGGDPNAAFELSDVDIYDFGMGATPGKTGIYINTRNIGVFPRVLVRGGMIRGGGPNANYGILYNGNARAEFSGGEISEINGIGFAAPNSVDFRLLGKRIFFCDKAVEIVNGDRFIVANNLLTDNAQPSTWSGGNCKVEGNMPEF